MLLHAFSSMFVSSPHEFPENCVYNHNGLNVLLNICTENYLLQIFSLMILKLLKKKKKVHLLDLHIKTMIFLFYLLTMYLILAKND